MNNHEAHLAWLAGVIREKQEEKFFGALTIVFREGDMIKIDVQESLVPPA